MADKKFGHRYQKIHSRLWEDEKVIKLSTDAHTAYLYLLSNKHVNIVGFYVLSFPATRMIGGFKDWQAFKNQIEEIVACGMAKFDEEKSLVLIENFLKYNPITSPPQMEGAHKVLMDLPKSKLFHDFLDRLEDPKISGLGINAQLVPIVRGMLGAVGDISDCPSPMVPVVIVDEMGLEWVVEKWNAMSRLFGLSEVLKITEQRRITIKKRLEEYSAEKIGEVFDLVSKSPFLTGENDRGWKADFDFVMSKSKFTKILEGSYRGNGVSKKKDTFTNSMEAIQRVAEEQFPHNQLGEEEDGPQNIPPGLTDDSGEF